ncbi:hypothetical protein OAA06_02385, partial [bacterium]|nr:hypothetical protein [bacterium]
MIQKLSHAQIEYCFYHLKHNIVIDDEIKSRIRLVDNTSNINELEFQNKILFLKSNTAFDINKCIFLDDLPILFPSNNHQDKWYSMNEGKLVFHHDILKSVFYLLSGAYEYENPSSDSLGRYPYKDSLPKKLDCINKPIVNYYFDIIYKGLNEYCTHHQLPIIKKRSLCNGPT